MITPITLKWMFPPGGGGGAIYSNIVVACVAGGFGGRESRAKTSGAAAAEMGREPRQSLPCRFATRFPIKTASYAGYIVAELSYF